MEGQLKSNDSGADNKRLKVDDPMKLEYIGFVGCYTKAGQADPFEASHGGVPHDRTKIGKGVLAIGVDSKGKLSFLNDGKPIIAADELPNPSYLCILGRSESKSRPAGLRGGGLCIVSEVEEGRMHSFAVSCEQKHSGMKITALDVGKVMDSGGAYPCHLISSTLEVTWNAYSYLITENMREFYPYFAMVPAPWLLIRRISAFHLALDQKLIQMIGKHPHMHIPPLPSNLLHPLL